MFIDAHGDVCRLAVQEDFDIGAVVRETNLIIADVLDDITGDIGDQFAIDHPFALACELVACKFFEQRVLTAAFAGDDDLVGGHEGLAAKARVHGAIVGDAKLGIIGQEGIEDRVGDLIGDLIRMAFRHRFTGKQIRLARHRHPRDR